VSVVPAIRFSTNSHIFELIQKALAIHDFQGSFDPEMGYWPAEDSRESLVITKFDNYKTLILRDFVLIIV
jgi:hypothetical protein